MTLTDELHSNHLVVFRAKYCRRSLARGMSLLEILVVITIITALTAAIAINVFGASRDSKKKQAQIELSTIANQGERWVDQPGHQGCPTVQVLITERMLAPQYNTTDPWGTAYSLSCPADEPVVVSSAGPDRRAGTADDIVSNTPASARKPLENLGDSGDRA